MLNETNVVVDTKRGWSDGVRKYYWKKKRDSPLAAPEYAHGPNGNNRRLAIKRLIIKEVVRKLRPALVDLQPDYNYWSLRGPACRPMPIPT